MRRVFAVDFLWLLKSRTELQVCSLPKVTSLWCTRMCSSAYRSWKAGAWFPVCCLLSPLCLHHFPKHMGTSTYICWTLPGQSLTNFSPVKELLCAVTHSWDRGGKQPSQACARDWDHSVAAHLPSLLGLGSTQSLQHFSGYPSALGRICLPCSSSVPVAFTANGNRKKKQNW